jgi:hypothetical protein
MIKDVSIAKTCPIGMGVFCIIPDNLTNKTGDSKEYVFHWHLIRQKF